MARGPDRKTEAEQVAFFEAWHERFLRAVDAAGEVRHCFRVADRNICLKFAGASLVPHLTPALDHLRVPDHEEPVDLTLCIWDSLSTGTELVPGPWRQEDLTDRGEIWGMTSPRVKVAFHWDEGSVNLMDHASGTGMFWVSHAGALPYWVRSAPLRTLFHWGMERHGCQLLHAAAIGAGGRAVLLTGKGGSGKSTAALSCLRAGLDYLADDYLVVRLQPEPVACSLYCTAKLHADHLANFPDLRALVRDFTGLDQEKAVIYLHPAFAGQIATQMPLAAIVAPRIAGGLETTLTAASAWAMQRAVSFETMSQLPHVGAHTHDTICRLVSTIPGYALNMGRDLQAIPAAITDLLAERATGREQSTAPGAPALAAEKPLVTVIVPVLNGEHVIADAVHNVLAQNYPPIELIIVDRGSTDRTEETVSRLRCEIRYFTEHGEPGAARNRGIKEAAGEIIAFADVNEPWLPHYLTSLVSDLRRDPELQVVHGYERLAAQDPRGHDRRAAGLNDVFQFFGAAAYRKSVFAKVGLFDEAVRYGEAHEWFGRAAESGVKIRRIEDPTLLAGRHGPGTIRAFKAALDRKRAEEAQIRGAE